MKMNQLFTAYYSNRTTVYEKPLDYIYSIQGDAKVEIKPTIWLWKASNSNVYFVDYISESIGCTLFTFDNLKDAEKCTSDIGQMNEDEFENWLINVHWKQQ